MRAAPHALNRSLSSSACSPGDCERNHPTADQGSRHGASLSRSTRYAALGMRRPRRLEFAPTSFPETRNPYPVVSEAYVNLIGKDIRDARKSAGLSQAGLGELAGISRHAVSYWECKVSSRPHGCALQRIADDLERRQSSKKRASRLRVHCCAKTRKGTLSSIIERWYYCTMWLALHHMFPTFGQR
ncbi:hypothetical protein C8J32_10645 [Rhizobium sp. PP-CC-3A-592]|nr:hypothetical protein C8J32_10645 [Rhizobium sp. PP-CC-3A-592]